MVNQKKITAHNPSNGQNHKPADNSFNRPVNFTANLSDVAHDIMQLVELQGKLFTVDVQEAGHKLKLPIVLALVATVLCLGGIPLLFVAMAQGLMLAGLLPWAAYTIVGTLAIGLGALLFYQSLNTLKDSSQVMDRSRAELSQNVAWMKQMLRQRSEAARADAGCRP